MDLLVKRLVPWLLLSLSLMAFWQLLRSGYFPMHDDLHPMRVQQMRECFEDLQIPCRWSPDMGYGYGYPQFHYYPPLPYYVTGFIHWLGFSVLSSVKWGFVLSFVGSVWGMYLLGKHFWGTKGGVLSSLFYTFLPYRAVNVYARGAMGEVWAMMWFPWVFWSLEKFLATRQKKYIVGLGISLSGLMTSHLLSTMMLALFLVPWALWRLWKTDEKLRTFMGLGAGGILGLGLSAYYVLPVIFERSAVHIDTLTMGYFSYYNHFVSIQQLLTNTHWGYGASEVWPRDDLSFQVGIFHWTVALLALGLVWWLRKTRMKWEVLLLVMGGFGYLFLIHSKSSMIWRAIEPLHWLQFPWRLLAPSGFLFSLAAGAYVGIAEKVSYKQLLVLIIPLVFVGVSFTQVKYVLDITDKDKFSGVELVKQKTNSIFDYLPIDADFPPTDPAPEQPVILNAQGTIENLEKGTDWMRFTLQVDQGTSILLPIFMFPGWQVMVDGNAVPLSSAEETGAIIFPIEEPGNYQIEAQLRNTPIRILGNGVTLISLVGIFFLLRSRHLKAILHSKDVRAIKK